MFFFILIRCYFFDVFSYGFYTDLDDDELLGYFPLKLEEYNTSGDFAEMDIIFNRRVFCFIVFCNRYCWKQRNRYDALFPGVSKLFSGDFFQTRDHYLALLVGNFWTICCHLGEGLIMAL